VDLNTVATTIGIPLSQLQQELARKSMSDIASSHGKSAAELATALKNAAHRRIDQEVTAGRLTADQAESCDRLVERMFSTLGLF
jgi:hypothetical protein